MASSFEAAAFVVYSDYSSATISLSWIIRNITYFFLAANCESWHSSMRCFLNTFFHVLQSTTDQINASHGKQLNITGKLELSMYECYEIPYNKHRIDSKLAWMIIP